MGRFSSISDIWIVGWLVGSWERLSGLCQVSQRHESWSLRSQGDLISRCFRDEVIKGVAGSICGGSGGKSAQSDTTGIMVRFFIDLLVVSEIQIEIFLGVSSLNNAG